MTVDQKEKQEIFDQFGATEDDTGSAPVQVAVLTHRIAELTDHLKEHPNDHDGRQGLLTMVGRRKRLLDYLRMNDTESYREVVDELGLRH